MFSQRFQTVAFFGTHVILDSNIVLDQEDGFYFFNMFLDAYFKITT
jgi:hypothetical protein